ncbi:hypothetical protein [Brevundimonas sp.]|jgi:hypothetical protein|uniref:hypothetical protein n=1 Tax=Brevundimonas sp. TaxID=1871086 RepID=UPI002E144F29|nr:hypothetical protein [Brevundimonas sp.]
MNQTETKPDVRPAGLVMTASAAAALFLMMHHPTSLNGPDDGLLARDMANDLVHGGMIACLIGLGVGVDALSRRLGGGKASVVAGRWAWNLGAGGLIAAALINGFALARVAAALPPSEGRQAAMTALWTLNQVLGAFGLVTAALATGLLAVSMVRVGGLLRIAGAVGVVMAVLAPIWALTTGGDLNLHDAVISMALFSAWAALAGAALTRAPSTKEPG